MYGTELGLLKKVDGKVVVESKNSGLKFDSKKKELLVDPEACEICFRNLVNEQTVQSLANMAENFLLDPPKDEPIKLTGTKCSVCGKMQFETLSGVTCANGHGGADPMEEDDD